MSVLKVRLAVAFEGRSSCNWERGIGDFVVWEMFFFWIWWCLSRRLFLIIFLDVYLRIWNFYKCRIFYNERGKRRE